MNREGVKATQKKQRWLRKSRLIQSLKHRLEWKLVEGKYNMGVRRAALMLSCVRQWSGKVIRTRYWEATSQKMLVNGVWSGAQGSSRDPSLGYRPGSGMHCLRVIQSINYFQGIQCYLHMVIYPDFTLFPILHIPNGLCWDSEMHCNVETFYSLTDEMKIEGTMCLKELIQNKMLKHCLKSS